LLSNHVDRVYCIFAPEISRFRAVEKYYKEFGQLTDAEVILSIKRQQY
jgi:predicted phosphoribosyltransferase